MTPALTVEPQRTMDYESDPHHEPLSPLERKLKLKKSTKVKRSRKGLNGGAKWQFTEAEVVKLLEVMKNLRDQIMLRLGIYLGLRISELLSLTMNDVLDADGLIKDVIIIPSARLKGGKEPKPKVYEREEGHEEGKCFCRNCQLVEGKIIPKVRRRPEDLPKWLSPQAKRLIQRLLDRLAKTPAPDPANPNRFLFESRKARAKQTDPKINRPITRQQAWQVIKSAAKRAQLPYIGRAGTHSLRKSYAINTLRTTGNIRKVMVGLGHRSQNTTEHYVEHDSRETFEALKASDMENSLNLEVGLVA